MRISNKKGEKSIARWYKYLTDQIWAHPLSNNYTYG